VIVGSAMRTHGSADIVEGQNQDLLDLDLASRSRAITAAAGGLWKCGEHGARGLLAQWATHRAGNTSG
jgi:hypothetical protein